MQRNLHEHIVATTVATVGWSHYKELLPIEDDLKRNFYGKKSADSNAGVYAGSKTKCACRSEVRTPREEEGGYSETVDSFCVRVRRIVSELILPALFDQAFD